MTSAGGALPTPEMGAGDDGGKTPGMRAISDPSPGRVRGPHLPSAPDVVYNMKTQASEAP